MAKEIKAPLEGYEKVDSEEYQRCIASGKEEVLVRYFAGGGYAYYRRIPAPAKSNEDLVKEIRSVIWDRGEAVSEFFQELWTNVFNIIDDKDAALEERLTKAIRAAIGGGK